MYMDQLNGGAVSSVDGLLESSEESKQIPPPSSSNDITESPQIFSAWRELPSEPSPAGESFQDMEAKIYWCNSTHSDNLELTLLESQSLSLAEKSLALRRGNTHLPLKPERYFYGSQIKTRLTYSGSKLFLANLLLISLGCAMSASGRLTLRDSAPHGLVTSDTPKQSFARR